MHRPPHAEPGLEAADGGHCVGLCSKPGLACVDQFPVASVTPRHEAGRQSSRRLFSLLWRPAARCPQWAGLPSLQSLWWLRACLARGCFTQVSSSVFTCHALCASSLPLLLSRRHIVCRAPLKTGTAPSSSHRTSPHRQTPFSLQSTIDRFWVGPRIFGGRCSARSRETTRPKPYGRRRRGRVHRRTRKRGPRALGQWPLGPASQTLGREQPRLPRHGTGSMRPNEGPPWFRNFPQKQVGKQAVGTLSLYCDSSRPPTPETPAGITGQGQPPVRETGYT